MSRGAATLLSIIVAALSVANGQQPARDAASGLARHVGTAVLDGFVTLGDSARTPVRRAVVTLAAVDNSNKLAAISGDDGHFVLDHVPAGQYTLSANKPGYLTIPYGARRSGRRGTMVVVTEGQQLADLTLSLPLGAVLAGRVTFPDGQPAPNVQIMTVPSWLATARATPAGSGREFRTDDRGEFRLFGLEPDTYLIAALPSFGVSEFERRSDSAVSALLRQLQRPVDSPPPTVSSVSTVAYAPTYFPGTPSVGDAERITVGAGQVREDLDFTIIPFPAATIRGIVVGTDGKPIQGVALSLERVGPAFPMAATAVGRVEPPNRNGEFQVSGVSPGLYHLRARAGGVTLDGDGAKATIHPEGQTQYAVAEVTISGTDVAGLVLTMKEGNHLTGTLRPDRSAVSPTWTGVSVIVEPVTTGSTNSSAVVTSGVPTRQASVDDKGRFTVTGLEPFDYQIRLILPPAMLTAGWHLESVQDADRDLRDAPLTFDDSRDGVEIRLTTKTTELAGQLTTELGTPAKDYFLVVFPADRALWHASSPRVRVMRPAIDGAFSTQDLPAGAYRLAVVTDVQDQEPRQKAFLESIYEESVAISIALGQTTRQDLRVGRRPNLVADLLVSPCAVIPPGQTSPEVKAVANVKAAKESGNEPNLEQAAHASPIRED